MTVSPQGGAAGLPTGARLAKARRVQAPDTRRQRSLSVGDWVAGAIDLLAMDTVRSVRISTLCARLGVTKGSFYWHFGSRAELLAAILADWRRRMTLDVITRLSQVASSTDNILRNTLALIRKPRSARSSAVERSIRDWARTEVTAQAVLEEVDETRLRFFESLFLQRGFPPEEARLRGYAAYALMMGDSILQGTVGGKVDSDRYLDRVVALLLTDGEPGPPAPKLPTQDPEAGRGRAGT